MKKSQLIGAGIASLSLAAMLGVGLVSAANTTTSTSLVDKLVAKFNLKKADVQAVFDQDRTEHQAARMSDEKTRLDQLVTDGKITADQETKIIAKQAEIKTFMDSLRDKTQAERQAAMKTQREADQKWATDNKIPMQYLHMGGGRGGFGGHGHGGLDGDMPAGAPTTPAAATN